MPKILAYILGPELLWVILYCISGPLAARNVPPTPAGNVFLERCCWIGVFLATALTFTVFAVPGTNRWVLLARVVIAVVIGVNACSFKLIDGIDYGDSSNSGLMGLWIYAVMTSALALVPGVITTIILLYRAAKGR